MSKKADAYVRTVVTSNPNMLVPHYLMHSYLYYVMDRPLVSDKLYDEICVRLYEGWESIEHYHKHLVEREALTAGTGFHLTYPERVQHGAKALTQRFR